MLDIRKWRAAVGPHWRRVVYVLNRGGRYQNYEEAFDGEKVKNKYGKQINLYCEKVAKTKNSVTGKPLLGLAIHLPIADSRGRPLVTKEGDLHLITRREIFHTKSRTPGNPWLRELYPENSILVNAKDAARLGLKNGDLVRVVSESNPSGVWELPNFGEKPMVGRVQVIQGIRPGVISFSLGQGHWAYGASDAWIDGARVPGDPRRGTGVHANAAMAVDPHLGNVCLQDLVGGSVSFYDSPVRLVTETSRDTADEALRRCLPRQSGQDRRHQPGPRGRSQRRPPLYAAWATRTKERSETHVRAGVRVDFLPNGWAAVKNLLG